MVMLKTKSIIEKKQESDGLRISIMSRHTLNDGVTPHPQINSSSYDLWMRVFSPPLSLLGDYYEKGLSWDQFEKRYLAYLQTPEVLAQVQTLALTSLDSTITLLCIEQFPDYCHRRLLAEECKKYKPLLELSIK